MIVDITKLYMSLLRGLLVLAAAGTLTGGGIHGAADSAADSVRQGLISLSRLNAAFGM
jgi:hypothetical protein